MYITLTVATVMSAFSLSAGDFSSVDTLMARARPISPVAAMPVGPLPRIGNIWNGNYVLNTSPSQAAKTQIYLGPSGMTPSQALWLRSQNPNVLILPSVNAQETTGGSPAVPDDYLLKDVNGNPIEDWPGNFILNMTKPEVAAFLAQYAYQEYFLNSGQAFDGLFWDNFNTDISNVLYDYLGVAHQVDANGDKQQDDQATLDAAWNQGMHSLLSNFKLLAPNAYVSGHISQAQPTASVVQDFNGQSFTLNALEVREGVYSFETLFSSYNNWFTNGRAPAIATIQSSPPSQIAYGYGFQPLQHMLPSTVQFAQSFYPNMRFGLALALMNDGFSIYDFGDIGAPVAWWYDEYDFNLGSAVTPARQIGAGGGGTLLTNGGFESGLSGWSLNVNNDGMTSATAEADTSIVAAGTASATIHVATPSLARWHVDFEHDGVALTAGAAYRVQFWARSDSPRSITVSTQGGAPDYANYGLSEQVSLTDGWQSFALSFTAPVTANDGRIEFWAGDQAGSVWLDDVQLLPTGEEIYRRDFTNGTVLLNGTSVTQTIPLEPGFRKFSSSQAPLWQYILDDSSPNFTADSSWGVMTYDSGFTDYSGASLAPLNPNPPYYHAWNLTAHRQTTGNTPAQWSLNVPADGNYTVQVWLPAAPDASSWTKSAVYEVVSNGVVIATSTLDQTIATAGDGWHQVAAVRLSPAGAPVLRVHNAGSGALLADAVYVTSAALFNDGSAVSQVTLGPYDGVLLQRLTAAPAPASHVNSVVNAAGFQNTISSAGLVSITGSGFGTSTRGWSATDRSSANLPVTLDGISVTINGKPAYVEHVSPTQIDVIAPDDDTVGEVQVQVVTPQGAGYPGTALKQRVSPAFFTYNAGTTIYVAAQHLDGTLVGRQDSSSRPAAPGEIIEIYGTGFGATSAAMPTSGRASQPVPLLSPVTVSIGGIDAEVQCAGLVSPGLYRLQVKVPNVADGDQQARTHASGFSGPVDVFLPVSSK